MIIQEGQMVTRIIETKITKAVDLTLNAVRLVKKGSTAGKVVVSTADVPAAVVEGAIFAIGPPQQDQEDANVDEPVTVMRKKVCNLILKSGFSIEDQGALGAAADGEVYPITLSATPTDDEMAMIVAYAQEDANASAGAVAVEALLVV